MNTHWDHSVFIRICMQEHIQLFGCVCLCVCLCFLFKCCREHAWLYLMYIFFMILFIGIEELTAISSSYI